MTIKTIIQNLNEKLSPEYKFKLDLIHSTPVRENGTQVLEYLGKADTIYNDMSTVPKSLLPKSHTSNKCKKIIHWINEKIFFCSIKQLQMNRNPFFFTELVRLRIAVNLIDKVDDLKKEEKDEWQMQLKEVYYERKHILQEYYITNIAQLPF